MSGWDNLDHLMKQLAAPRPQGESLFWRVIPDQTVGTTPVKLVAQPLAGRRLLVVQNNGTEPIRVGNENVSATAGILIKAGDAKDFPFGEQIEVYVVATTGTAKVGGFQAY